MYMMVEDQEIIRIPPDLLGSNIDEVLINLAREKLEGKIRSFDKSEVDPSERKYVIILINSVERIENGMIIPGDGAVYQKIKYEALAFHPELNEVIEGEVVEIMNFGAFVRFGPVDGLLHISQILDDRFDVDLQNKRLIGKESKKDLRIKDKIRAKFVAISLNEDNIRESKIGLTMRQSGLGKFEYLKAQEARKDAGT